MLNNSTNASDLEGGNETEVAGLDCPRFDDAAMKMVEGFSFWYKIKHLRNLFWHLPAGDSPIKNLQYKYYATLILSILIG